MLATLCTVRAALAEGIAMPGPQRQTLDLILSVAKAAADEAHELEQAWLGGASRKDSFLTQRERQVLELAAQGIRRVRIADALGISKRTVDMHLTNAAGKLGVVGAPAAVARARELGLLSGY